MSVPNLLAAARILLSPVVLVLIVFHDSMDHGYGIAVTVFTIAALTDFADGYLARRWEITTVLGAFLDSVADKMLVTAGIVALVEVGRAWAWVAFVIIGRELAVMGLRGVAAMTRAAVPPSFWGKLKATFQFVAIGLAMLRLPESWGPLFLDEWVMLAAVLVTVMSAVEYFRHFGSVLRVDRAGV